MGHITGTRNDMMETMHVRKFYEQQYRIEGKVDEKITAEWDLAELQTTAFRATLLKQMGTMGTVRKAMVKKLDREDKIHKALLKRKRKSDVEREELRVEMALSEKARRMRLEELSHASLDVNRGIDAFEINMKRLVKMTNDDDTKLVPATTHNPMELMVQLRSQAPPTSKLLEDSVQYMSTVKEEALVALLAEGGLDEQQQAFKVWQQRHDEEEAKLLRLEREAEYGSTRNLEWEAVLKSGVEDAEKKATWRAELDAYKAQESAENAAVCEEIAWQRAAEYRVNNNALVPLKEWRKWLALFKTGDPELGAPFIKAAPNAVSPRHLEDPVSKHHPNPNAEPPVTLEDPVIKHIMPTPMSAERHQALEAPVIKNTSVLNFIPHSPIQPTPMLTHQHLRPSDHNLLDCTHSITSLSRPEPNADPARHLRTQ
eukprot:gene3482-13544_t